MALHSTPFILSAILILGAGCQTIQDSWTAPTTPDGSTSLQGGAPFTIRWKPELEDAFGAYCTSCDIKKLDLWVTSFVGESFNFKIAGSVDITATSSFQWDVNIPSAALVANDYWVLRFTPAGAKAPFTEQISSSGFYISGPPQPSTVINTVTAQPSSASSSAFESSTASSNTSAGATPFSVATNTPSGQDSDSSSKSWIAGAVVGPVAGITLVAVLLWFFTIRSRKNNRVKQADADVGEDIRLYHPARPMYQGGEGKYAQTIVRPPQSMQAFELAGDWQYQTEGQGQSPAEMPDSAFNRGPVELWPGNYKSTA